MRCVALLALMPFALAAPVAAQTMDHTSMPEMAMPAAKTQPSKKAKSKAHKPTAKAPGAGHHAQVRGRAGSRPHHAIVAPKHTATGGAMAGMNMAAHPTTRANPSMSQMEMPPSRTPARDHGAVPAMSMPAGQDDRAMPGMSMQTGNATQDHSSMPGMSMPEPAGQAGGMAGMPMPESGSSVSSSMPGMNMGGAGAKAQPDIPKSPPPPPPTDHVADQFYPPEAMDIARTELRREHGGGAVPYSKYMANLAEYQIRNGADGYRWDGQAWFGGDIHRFVVRSEGEGSRGDGIETAEVQALYSRAVGVYTDLQVGLRQDFSPHDRTYVTAGFQTLFPYWFEVEGAVFLSNHGEVLGRVEGTYDVRLTNRLILQPRAEVNLSAQDTEVTRTGSGISNAELGLRLRYEMRREFAPYIGVSWDRRFGRSADYERLIGKDVESKSIVVGIRTFF